MKLGFVKCQVKIRSRIPRKVGIGWDRDASNALDRRCRPRAYRRVAPQKPRTSIEPTQLVKKPNGDGQAGQPQFSGRQGGVTGSDRQLFVKDHSRPIPAQPDIEFDHAAAVQAGGKCGQGVFRKAGAPTPVGAQERTWGEPVEKKQGAVALIRSLITCPVHLPSGPHYCCRSRIHCTAMARSSATWAGCTAWPGPMYNKSPRP